MTHRLIGLLFLATLLTLAPVAAADAEGDNATADRPDDAAWVEDCPPDMMCAYSHHDSDDNVTRGPEDCENCRFGPDDCIDCSGLPMPTDDNTTWGTDCPPGVFCMADGDGSAPASNDAEEAPTFGIFVLLGAVALVGAAFVAALRK